MEEAEAAAIQAKEEAEAAAIQAEEDAKAAALKAEQAARQAEEEAQAAALRAEKEARAAAEMEAWAAGLKAQKEARVAALKAEEDARAACQAEQDAKALAAVVLAEQESTGSASRHQEDFAAMIDQQQAVLTRRPRPSTGICCSLALQATPVSKHASCFGFLIWVQMLLNCTFSTYCLSATVRRGKCCNCIDCFYL